MIRSLPQTGRPILVFSGGEPLKRPDIFDLAAAEATPSGCRTALATNGTLVDDTVARKIVEAGFRRVSISFDGPDAPTHDIFRGTGAFDKSIAGFKALRGRRNVDADQYHHRQAQFPQTRRNLPTGAGSGAPMRCTRSCWCRLDAACRWIRA